MMQEKVTKNQKYKGKKTEAKDIGPENWQKSYRCFKGYL